MVHPLGVCVCVFFFFFKNLLNYLFYSVRVELIYNVVLVSGVQQRASVTYTFSYNAYIFTLFQTLDPYRLLQSIEESSLYCTVGPCWLSIFI